MQEEEESKSNKKCKNIFRIRSKYNFDLKNARYKKNKFSWEFCFL